MRKDLLDRISYEGLVGFANKIYEKLWINRRRFSQKKRNQSEETAIEQEIPECKISSNENSADLYDGCSNDTVGAISADAKKGAETDTANNTIEINQKTVILFLTHYFFPERSGGTERFVYQMAKQHIRSGKRVHVLTLGQKPENWYHKKIGSIFYREYEYEGIAVTEIRYEKMPLGLYYNRISDDLRQEEFAKQFLDRLKPDFVHAAYPQPYYPFLQVCNRLNIEYGVTLTDFALFCHYTMYIDKKGEVCPGSQCGKRCKRICKTYGVADYEERYRNACKIIKNAKFVAAPSEYVKRRVGMQVCVIPHGVSDVFIRADKISGEMDSFLFVGTLIDIKGADLLMRAFAGLQKGRLLIVGKGNPVYEKKLKKLAGQIDSNGERIQFAEKVEPEKMPRLYREAGCVVIPSFFPETYSYVLSEALASGCYVIVSDKGAMPQRLGECIRKKDSEPFAVHRYGMVVANLNEESWTNALSYYLENAKELINYGKTSVVQSVMTVENEFVQYEKLRIGNIDKCLIDQKAAE